MAMIPIDMVYMVLLYTSIPYEAIPLHSYGPYSYTLYSQGQYGLDLPSDGLIKKSGLLLADCGTLSVPLYVAFFFWSTSPRPMWLPQP